VGHRGGNIEKDERADLGGPTGTSYATSLERSNKADDRKGKIAILTRRDYLNEGIMDELNEEDLERLRKDQALEDAKTLAGAGGSESTKLDYNAERGHRVSLLLGNHH
jgi:hypothetical protein